MIAFLFDKSARLWSKSNLNRLQGNEDFSLFHSFKIVHCLRRVNVLLNTLYRAICTTTPVDSPFNLHESLCYPRVTRLSHFQQTMNLLFSILRISKVTMQQTSRLLWMQTPLPSPWEGSSPCQGHLAVWEDQHRFQGFFQFGWAERGGVGSCPAICPFCTIVCLYMCLCLLCVVVEALIVGHSVQAV